MTSQALSLDCSDETESERCADSLQVKAQRFVGDHAVRLSEEEVIELERHIKRCTYLMQEALNRMHGPDYFSAKGEADRWRLLRDAAIQQLQQ